jgi:phosphoglucomutase
VIATSLAHTPPEDRSFYYNPPDSGPHDTDVTRQSQDTANELLRAGLRFS